ncbi:hypothetical protein RJ639_030892 [Escallonia herrerae]|uniref:Reverse transcriptase RNase H-like domain-containing protein n=1 Tax=Escallonia herrerae TaxID=1293975 RepID=A0AA88WZ25_9ASTE|nr:hypothetical protein RJ639_030892 [Escallonia herrerae]
MGPRHHSQERSPPKEESRYPLSEAIEKAKLPPNFRMPQCNLYDRTGDPGEHVYQFETNMLLLQVSDAVMCRAFPTTPRKAVHAWFKSLQPSSAEVLFYDAFKKMNIPTDHLRKMDTPLYGFFNHPIAVEALNQLQAVVLTYHLKMKFPTEHRIGEVKGDQTTAPAYMPRIDPEVITHRLNVDPSKKPVKQKKRTFVPERQEKIEEEESKKIFLDGLLSKIVRRTQNILEFSTLLSEPLPGEDLFLYLSVTEVTVRAVLVREEDRVQKPIYYVSKVLQDVETRYPKIDKIGLALIISARHLRPYFQSHTIVVLTDQPLRKVLLSPEASGRLVNWYVELGEFDIQYKSRTAIKAQALADFIVECTLLEDPLQLVISKVTDPWNIYVDGSSTVGSSGAKIILIRDYEARNERMAQYLQLVKTLAVKLKNFTIRQIPRDQNTLADTLSRLASAEETNVRRSIYLEFLKDRSISSQAEIEMIDQEPCWMDMIIKYFSTGKLPSKRHEARNLRVKAARYALVEGILYKKSFSLPYLRCLRPSESLYAL